MIGEMFEQIMLFKITIRHLLIKVFFHMYNNVSIRVKLPKFHGVPKIPRGLGHSHALIKSHIYGNFDYVAYLNIKNKAVVAIFIFKNIFLYEKNDCNKFFIPSVIDISICKLIWLHWGNRILYQASWLSSRLWFLKTWIYLPVGSLYTGCP